jgi:peroxiredoxin
VPKEIKEGAKAPAFKLPAAGGGEVSLKDFAGQTLVLYFYPKDDTAGCTAEAKAFSGLEKSFKKAGARVVGVSKDSVAAHETFIKKHALHVDLAADAAGKAVAAYGVWVEKSMYGRKFMGIERATFLIDGAGIVRKVWRKVKVAGHAEEVLAAAADL